MPDLDDGGGDGTANALGENYNEIVTVLFGEDNDGGVVIDRPIGAVPSPANFVINLGGGEAGGEPLTPVVGGGRLVEQGVLDGCPLVGGEVGVFPVELEQAGEIASGSVETGVGGASETEARDESFNAGSAVRVAAQRVGAAVVGLTDDEVKAGAESEVAFVGGGDEVGVGGVATGGDFAVAVVGIE